ncbi:MAG: hypothetical protein ABSF43_10950 [Rectinemataceae bacterium]
MIDGVVSLVAVLCLGGTGDNDFDAQPGAGNLKGALRSDPTMLHVDRRLAVEDKGVFSVVIDG